MLFRHQRPAYRALRTTAEVFFWGDWRKLAVVPRFTRLLIGPSGTGKTHLIRRLAAELQVPLFEVVSVNWIPLGCSERGAAPTWRQIAKFCHDKKEGIIFIDEVDKLGERSSWMNHLRAEIFSALDRVLPENLSWEEDDDCEHTSSEECRNHAKNTLSRKILVVGGGAFQDLWTVKNSKAMGFGSLAPVAAVAPEQQEIASVIPTEVANRFVTPPLLLLPLGEPEYRCLLEQLCGACPAGLPNASERPVRLR